MPAHVGLRLWAYLIDLALLVPLMGALDQLLYAGAGVDSSATNVFADVVTLLPAPLLYCVAFWKRWGGTPGKLLLWLRVVDARTGGKPSDRQLPPSGSRAHGWRRTPTRF